MKILEETNNKIVVKIEEDPLSKKYEKELYEAYKKAEKKIGVEFNDTWKNDDVLILEKCELKKCKICGRNGVKKIKFEDGSTDKVCVLCLKDLAENLALLPKQDKKEILEDAKRFLSILKGDTK